MAIAWRTTAGHDWCLASDPALTDEQRAGDTLGFVPAPPSADVTRFRLRPLSSAEYIEWATETAPDARTAAAWRGVVSIDGEAVAHDAVAGALVMALVAIVLRLSEGSVGPFLG